MRNPKRIPEILEAIREVWTEHPDLRLGQLITIAVGYQTVIADVFYIEDNELLLQIRKTKVRLEKET